MILSDKLQRQVRHAQKTRTRTGPIWYGSHLNITKIAHRVNTCQSSLGLELKGSKIKSKFDRIETG